MDSFIFAIPINVGMGLVGKNKAACIIEDFMMVLANFGLSKTWYIFETG